MKIHVKNKNESNIYIFFLDDTFAPPLVCLALFIAFGANFYLRYNPTMVEGNKNIENDIDVYSSNINTSSLNSKPIIFNMQNV